MLASFDIRSLFRRKAEPTAQSGDDLVLATPTEVPPSSADPHVVGRKHLPPDPRIIQAIGRNHNFESAVADLVDNSLDAGASKILIRFMRDGDDLIGFYLADNGRGMTESTIDSAMTLGGQRQYDDLDLGHFGVGLKAASLSQARSLTVISRAAGNPAVGRRLQSDKVADGFACDLLSPEFAQSIMARPWGHVLSETGTVVIWNDVKAFPQIRRALATDAFLDDAVNRLCRHLGLVFHRIITAKNIEVVIDQEDLKSGETTIPFQVSAINPFGYTRSGRADYPRTLKAESDGVTLTLRCHIWPGRSNDPKFKLGGVRAEPPQGFFIYRNDRLLHSGSWHGVTLAKPELQLARVEIDMPSTADNLFEMNPEKTHVEPTKQFIALAHSAADSGTTFEEFLEVATTCYRESRRRTFERQRVLPPGSGIAPAVKSAIADELDFVNGRDPIEVRWAALDGDQFFEVDKETRLIRLNRRYRSLLGGEGRAGLNDAPLVKTLIYLLTEPALRGEMIGQRDKDNISIWQAILAAAAVTEEKRERSREENDT